MILEHGDHTVMSKILQELYKTISIDNNKKFDIFNVGSNKNNFTKEN